MRTFSVLAFLLITFSGCSSQTLHPSLLPGNYWPASLASAFADTAFATSQLDGTLTPGSCVLQINFGSCSIATAPISLSDCVKAAGISNVVVFTSTNALSFTLSPTDVCTIPSIVLFAEIGGISTQFVAANPLNGGVVVYGRPTVNSITMSPVGFFGSAEQTITIPGFLYGSAGVYNVSLGLVPTGDGSSCVSAPTVTAVVPVSEMQLRVSFIVSTDNDGCNITFINGTRSGVMFSPPPSNVNVIGQYGKVLPSISQRPAVVEPQQEVTLSISGTGLPLNSNESVSLNISSVDAGCSGSNITCFILSYSSTLVTCRANLTRFTGSGLSGTCALTASVSRFSTLVSGLTGITVGKIGSPVGTPSAIPSSIPSSSPSSPAPQLAPEASQAAPQETQGAPQATPAASLSPSSSPSNSAAPTMSPTLDVPANAAPILPPVSRVPSGVAPTAAAPTSSPSRLSPSIPTSGAEICHTSRWRIAIIASTSLFLSLLM